MAAPIRLEHVLVVDDDPMFRDMVARLFGRMNYRVTAHADGSQVINLLARTPIHIILLDLWLRQQNGHQLLEQIRRVSSVPVIMLTGDVAVENRISGLEGGADDYLSKPFQPRELLARVRNVLRRSSYQPEVAAPRAFRFGRLTIDLGHGEVRDGDGRQLKLTPFEFRLLAHLAQHADNVLTRDQLSSLIAHREWSYGDRTIDVLIAKLRRKLSPNPRAPFSIETVRGIGYMLRTS